MGALASADIACCSGVQYCVESVSILQEGGQESVAMGGLRIPGTSHMTEPYISACALMYDRIFNNVPRKRNQPAEPVHYRQVR